MSLVKGYDNVEYKAIVRVQNEEEKTDMVKRFTKLKNDEKGRMMTIELELAGSDCWDAQTQTIVTNLFDNQRVYKNMLKDLLSAEDDTIIDRVSGKSGKNFVGSFREVELGGTYIGSFQGKPTYTSSIQIYISAGAKPTNEMDKAKRNFIEQKNPDGTPMYKLQVDNNPNANEHALPTE